MIAVIALLDKIKNIKCHVSKERKRNMHNFASTIKSKHEYKILSGSKPKVLQRETELSRYILWTFAVTEKTICCRELHNLSALYPYIGSEHEIELQKVRQNFCRTPNRTEISVVSLCIHCIHYILYSIQYAIYIIHYVIYFIYQYCAENSRQLSPS